MKGYLPILITLLMFGCGRKPNTVQISYLQNDTLTEEPEILISADRQKDSIVYIPYDSIFANLYNSKMWNCKEMSGEAPDYIDSLNLDWYSLNLLMKNRLYPQAKELNIILPDSTTFNVIQKPRYNDIHYIDTMLMLSYCGGYDVVPAFQRELEKYLSLPITFKTKLPMFENSQGCNSEGGLFDKSNNGIYVLYTPDKKYKIYSYDDNTGGTGRNYRTYIQYQSAGKTYCKLFPPDQKESKQIQKIWVFIYHNTTYYVLWSYARFYSRSWIECLEIVTIKAGEPLFHMEFFPPGIQEKLYANIPTEELSTFYEENNRQGLEFPNGDSWLDINVDFNPKTLEVFYNEVIYPELGDRKSFKLLLP